MRRRAEARWRSNWHLLHRRLMHLLYRRCLCLLCLHWVKHRRWSRLKIIRFQLGRHGWWSDFWLYDWLHRRCCCFLCGWTILSYAWNWSLFHPLVLFTLLQSLLFLLLLHQGYLCFKPFDFIIFGRHFALNLLQLRLVSLTLLLSCLGPLFNPTNLVFLLFLCFSLSPLHLCLLEVQLLDPCLHLCLFRVLLDLLALFLSLIQSLLQ